MKPALLCIALIIASLLGAWYVSNHAQPGGEYWEVER